MLSNKPRYTTTEITDYIASIKTMSEERSKRLLDLRQYQNATSHQQLAWRAEIESYNRDIKSMQESLSHMLKRVRKEQGNE
jgi:hypothetical protein